MLALADFKLVVPPQSANVDYRSNRHKQDCGSFSIASEMGAPRNGWWRAFLPHGARHCLKLMMQQPGKAQLFLAFRRAEKMLFDRLLVSGIQPSLQVLVNNLVLDQINR